MAKSVHRRAGERVIRRNRAVRVEAENLAGERIHLLRQAAFSRITSSHVQLAVWTECHSTTVVKLRAGDIIENDSLLAQGAFFLPVAHYAIDDRPTTAARCIREIEQVVGCEPWVQGYRHKSAFAEVKDL